MGTNSSRRQERERSDEVSGGDRPATVELSSGMRLVIDHETREITIMAPERLVHGEGEEEEEEEEEEESGSDEEDMVLPTLGLIARLLGGGSHGSQSFQERDVAVPTATPMSPSCELYHQVLYDTGQLWQGGNLNICQQIAARQLFCDMPTVGQKISSTLKMLPKHSCLVDSFRARAFCGTYSKDGSVFLCACQDSKLHLYNTVGTSFKRYRSIRARDVGWSILDTDFSPDQQWFVYSTWSPYIHVCNVHGEEEHHSSLDMRPDMEDRFCAFSVKFSNDGSEIIASASDGYLYLYNRMICDRTLKIDAHQDDANAVTFADESSQIIFSGGDDGICKVWDRRSLSETHCNPVGILAGHKDGITFIDTKGDNRYLITNSKDQSIKLWDMRKFSRQEGIEATLSEVQQQTWDYRWQNVPKIARMNVLKKLPGDTSVMTYAGHVVKHTLLRCRFSPMATTGQRYIYTACARGRVIIYDVLTGEIVQKLTSDNCYSCIRDVSWHPYEPGVLVGTTWDGILQMWSYKKRPNYVPECRRQIFDFW